MDTSKSDFFPKFNNGYLNNGLNANFKSRILKSRQSFAQIITLAALIAAALMTSGCNKNNSGSNTDSGQPRVAEVPAPTANACLQPANPSAGANSWWPRYNAHAYPFVNKHLNSFSRGFCGCAPGTMPTCATQGLVCIPVRHMNMNVITWSWSTGGFNTRHHHVNPYTSYDHYQRERRHVRFHRFDHTPQPPPSAGTGGTCASSVAQLCSPNPMQPLIPGMLYCQPLEPGNFTGPGVWVRL